MKLLLDYSDNQRCADPWYTQGILNLLIEM